MTKEEVDRTIIAFLAEGDTDALEQAANKSVERIYQSYEPYWKAKNDLAKTIVSLTAGALVLTVTFGDKFFQDLGAVGTWKYLLFGCWGFLILSICAAVISLGLSLSFKRSKWLYHYESGSRTKGTQRAKELFEELYEEYGIEAVKQISDTLRSTAPKFVGAPSTGIEKLQLKRKHDIQLFSIYVSLASFVVALIMLGLLGWRQFAT